MIKKSRRGVTLIELILVLAIMGIVGSIPVNMYIVGQKSHASTTREFEIQSNLRLATQKLTNTIRTASATFLFSEVFASPELAESHYISAFKSDNAFGTDKVVKLTDAFLLSRPFLKSAVNRFAGWSFLILNNSKTELREFKWTITGVNANEGYYTMTRIIEEQLNPKMIYDIEYEKKNVFFEDAMLEFKIAGKVEGSDTKAIEIISQLEALNSLQVIDRGKEASTKSTAIFYRSDDRPTPTDNEAVVAMVLDKSGSMGYNMLGNSGNPTRLSILKTQANSMIDKFGQVGMGITNMNVTPFSGSGNVTAYTDFLDITKLDNRTNLQNIINALSANGGTNVGDGMRRAYYRIQSYNTDDALKDKNKYMIILMDGVPTYGSVHSKDGWFYSETDRGAEFTDEFGRVFSIDTSTSQPRNSGYYGKKFYFYKTKDGSPLYVLDSSEINESSGETYFRSKGGYHGTGSDDGINGNNRKIGKEYIDQVSKLFKNVKNSKGNTNIKVFLIGFSGVSTELDELKNIQDLIEANGISTKLWKATSGGDLNSVFNEIRNIIMEETWHIEGPDWSIPPEVGDD